MKKIDVRTKIHTLLLIKKKHVQFKIRLLLQMNNE